MSDMTIHTEAQDRELVDKAIASLTKPKSFVSYETKFSVDSSGDDATWITVRVNDGLAMSTTKTFEAIQNFVTELKQKLLNQGVSRWPYIMLISAEGSKERDALSAGKQQKGAHSVSRQPAKKAAKKAAKRAAKKATKKTAKRPAKKAAKKKSH